MPESRDTDAGRLKTQGELQPDVEQVAVLQQITHTGLITLDSNNTIQAPTLMDQRHDIQLMAVITH